MVTYQDLFAFCSVIIGLVTLVITIRNDKK